MPWIASGSLTRLPTVCRGLSDWYGSWKTICTRRRSARAFVCASGSPSNRTSPPVGGCRPSSARPSVDLPQPDSPTMPSTSPRRQCRSTPSMPARPAWARQRGSAPRGRASRTAASRRAAPERRAGRARRRSRLGAPRGRLLHLATAGSDVGVGIAPSGQGANRQRASCTSSMRTSAGASCVQRSRARWQRGSKRQPGGSVGRVGRHARDRRRELARAADGRERRQQPLRVRMLRRGGRGARPGPARRSGRRT